MDKIHDFEIERVISFSNRRSLIQFVSEYFAFKFEENLEFWRSTARNDQKARQEWDKAVEADIKRLTKTLKMLLRVTLTFKKTVKLTKDGFILKTALKRVKISPSCCFLKHNVFEIDDLVFFKLYC